ncbi:alpha/beta fold hydrolase [Flavobacterium amniphilum]|uniref:thioesterase II family protein n=1 Tax=Flavobacterium amniphilum TaxID=1834035 RepID=UPI00202A4711|nr:alpha/beta fold hydrolase [Flavobacterium amniphilum]MCL9807008.1 alpha/beta fold hydrolase [Flavobacterium amniphilum]
MNNQTKYQLFLLHFAGGNQYSFEFLKKEITNVNFIPLELPGRGKRHREELFKDKNQAIEDYFNQIKSLRNGEPYIIYGHSMGATLGLSVAAKLEAIDDSPELLVVTGNAGPGVKNRKDFLYHELDDQRFKEELIELGGIPAEVTDNDELFNYFSPIIRADFECLEKDPFSEEGLKLKTPVYALMGSDEENSDVIENWKNFTVNSFTHEILDGNHFFIHNHAEKLANIFTNQFYKQLTY